MFGNYTESWLEQTATKAFSKWKKSCSVRSVAASEIASLYYPRSPGVAAQ